MASKARSGPGPGFPTRRQFDDLRAAVRANQRMLEDLRREMSLTIRRCGELQRDIDALRRVVRR